MKVIYILIILLIIFTLGSIRIWDHQNLFGTKKINTFEKFGNCWQGDVRVCDYDFFDEN